MFLIIVGILLISLGIKIGFWLEKWQRIDSINKPMILYNVRKVTVIYIISIFLIIIGNILIFLNSWKIGIIIVAILLYYIFRGYFYEKKPERTAKKILKIFNKIDDKKDKREKLLILLKKLEKRKKQEEIIKEIEYMNNHMKINNFSQDYDYWKSLIKKILKQDRYKKIRRKIIKQFENSNNEYIEYNIINFIVFYLNNKFNK